MKTAFFDIDTQIDFLFPAGALYVPGAERLMPVLERLNRFAVEHGIPLISDMDSHLENDPEFRVWPPHCIAGAFGQRKPSTLLFSKRVVIPWRRADFSIEGAEQVIVEKQTLDVFDNPNLPRLLELLDAGRYFVYGVVTEYCVRCAVKGLLQTGRPVFLVTDAIETLNPEDSRRTLDEFTSAGGRLTTAAEVGVLLSGERPL
jgi:nicotinamidase/pyrazinamidase